MTYPSDRRHNHFGPSHLVVPIELCKLVEDTTTSDGINYEKISQIVDRKILSSPLPDKLYVYIHLWVIVYIELFKLII